MLAWSFHRQQVLRYSRLLAIHWFVVLLWWSLDTAMGNYKLYIFGVLYIELLVLLFTFYIWLRQRNTLCMYEPWKIKSGENERKELWIYYSKNKGAVISLSSLHASGRQFWILIDLIHHLFFFCTCNYFPIRLDTFFALFAEYKRITDWPIYDWSYRFNFSVSKVVCIYW